MDVAWNLSALSRYANTAEGREVGGNHSAARAKVANVPQCRQTFVLQHRIVTLIARNRRFTVDLSGARPRHLKSEFLSIGNCGYGGGGVGVVGYGANGWYGGCYGGGGGGYYGGGGCGYDPFTRGYVVPAYIPAGAQATIR